MFKFTIPVIIALIIAYVLGAKFPVLAQKVGIV